LLSGAGHAIAESGQRPLMLPAFRSVAAVRAQVAAWRQQGLRVALVPTMGALHRGHLTLVEVAKSKIDKVLVSIFVNPTQFGPNEDFAAYPRQEAKDFAQLESVGSDGVFAPTVEEMYPYGFATNVSVKGLTAGLEGAYRPGHFDGVATVVSKLLIQCGPDLALFGEKDYQQLQVIKRMVRDLDIPVAVQGVATVREADGLAMSSRNAYLSAEQRAIAPALYRVMHKCLRELQDGAPAEGCLAAGVRQILAAGFDSVDYLSLCGAEDLTPMVKLDRPARLIVAARLGKARLIDNIEALPT
jgi:pantoate--beta-alanine ligase